VGSGEIVSRIVDLTEYVVIQSFLEPRLIDALYDYFVNNVSPSDISEMYKIPKYLIRRHIQYVYSKINMRGVSASRLFKYVVDALKRVEIPQVFEHRGTYAVCRLCGSRISSINSYSLWLHLIKAHRDAVDSIVDDVLRELERLIKERRNGNGERREDRG